MTEFDRDEPLEMLPGAEAYGVDYSTIMKRIYDARQTYANTCLGVIVCGLQKKPADPNLNDALDVAKATAKHCGTLPTCGRVACESTLEASLESTSVQPCIEYTDGIYVSNIEHGPERPPASLTPTLPEEG